MLRNKVPRGLPLLLAAIVSSAMAQEPSPRRPAATTFGPMFGNPIELLRTGQLRGEVRKELAITADQEKEIEEAFKPVNELRGDSWEAQNLEPDERKKRMEEISKRGVERSKAAEEKLYQILNPKQVSRLKQLWLRFRGDGALSQPEVAKQLGLTEDQQARIRAIAASLAPKPGERKPAEMSQQERRAYFEDLNARRGKALADLVGVLTDEQKAKFAEMKGAEPPFSFAPRRLGSSSDRSAPPKPSR